VGADWAKTPTPGSLLMLCSSISAVCVNELSYNSNTWATKRAAAAPSAEMRSYRANYHPQDLNNQKFNTKSTLF
jgi:hypothetical protein